MSGCWVCPVGEASVWNSFQNKSRDVRCPQTDVINPGGAWEQHLVCFHRQFVFCRWRWRTLSVCTSWSKPRRVLLALNLPHVFWIVVGLLLLRCHQHAVFYRYRWKQSEAQFLLFCFWTAPASSSVNVATKICLGSWQEIYRPNRVDFALQGTWIV